MIELGQLVLLKSPRGKNKIMRLIETNDFHSQDGILAVADICAADFGEEVQTSLGVPFRIQKPQLDDLIMGIKRQTQIMYPKDMGMICMKLSVGGSNTIIEAGSGSGGFTIALSWFGGANATIHSFEAREEFHKLAQKNVDWAGLGSNVHFHHRDIANGFELENADALFLDVRTPWDYLDHASKALKNGAPLAFLLPTVDQVSKLLYALELKNFEDTEVCEILVRKWKPIPDRLRPEDRMNAHTGFLVFTRKQLRSKAWDNNLNLGTRERKQEAARQSRQSRMGGDEE